MKRFDAADAGQLDIHQYERRLLLACQLYALFCRPGVDGPIALGLQRVAHELQIRRVVLDDDQNQLISHDAPGS
jgi:hypothetical protein